MSLEGRDGGAGRFTDSSDRLNDMLTGIEI